MWSFFHWYHRFSNSVASRRTTRQRKALPRRPLGLEVLEDRWVPTTTSSIAVNFNATAVAPGSYIWFNSVANVAGVGTNWCNIYVTNQTISFSDTLGGVTTN